MRVKQQQLPLQQQLVSPLDWTFRALRRHFRSAERSRRLRRAEQSLTNDAPYVKNNEMEGVVEYRMSSALHPLRTKVC